MILKKQAIVGKLVTSYYERMSSSLQQLQRERRGHGRLLDVILLKIPNPKTHPLPSPPQKQMQRQRRSIFLQAALFAGLLGESMTYPLTSQRLPGLLDALKLSIPLMTHLLLSIEE